ncbi:GNAT family N-acetyltransferase [Kribbella sp. NPDC002412]
MVFEIRPARPEDAAGIARVWAATMPQLVKTARGIEAQLRTGKSQVVLVAVDGRDVAGFGTVYLPDPGERGPRVRIAVQVPPAVRRCGIGSALAEAVGAEAVKAGAVALLVVVADDAESKQFATRQGFTIGRRMSHSRADLSAVPPPAAAPSGLRLADYDQVDPRELWQAVVAVTGGDPSGLSFSLPYDEWLAVDWGHPDLRRDLSFAVLDGDTVLSFVTTTADPERKVIWSNLTGTIPPARGRGLAKVVKSAALAQARDAGFVAAYAGNDAGNAPMLAVNTWLGYEVSSSAWTAEKAL